MDQFQSTRPHDEPGTTHNPLLTCQVCILTFKTPEGLNAHRTLEHFFCKICDGNCKKCYESQEALEKHLERSHASSWCEGCRILFDIPTLKTTHLRVCHHYCIHCNIHFRNLTYLDKHDSEMHAERFPRPAANVPKQLVAGKYYTLLNVGPSASHEEMLRAARDARVKAHPDRFHRSSLSDQSWALILDNAKEVGRAADVLCDERDRQKYDSDVKYGRKE